MARVSSEIRVLLTGADAGFSRTVKEAARQAGQLSRESREVAQRVDRVGREARTASRGVDRYADRARRASSGTDFLKRSLIGVGAAFATAFGIRALGRAGKALFDLGVTAEETADKYRIVLGDSIGQANRFLDANATKMGLTRVAAQELFATTTAIAQGFGATGDAAAQMAEDIVRLGGDLGAFNNIPADEAIRAITSAMVGNTEATRMMGISFSRAESDVRAMELAGKSSAKELTGLERAMGVLDIVTSRAGVAVGNVEETLSSTQGQARQLRAEFENMRTDIATSLLPAFNALLTTVLENKDAIEDISQAIVRSFSGAVQHALTWVKRLKPELATAIPLLRFVDDNAQNEQALRRFVVARREEIADLREELAALQQSEPNFGPFTLPRNVSEREDNIKALTAEIEGLEMAAREAGEKLAALLSAPAGAGADASRPEAPKVFTDKELAEMRKQANIAANIRREVMDAERDFFERRFRNPDFSAIGGRAFRGETIAAELSLGPIETPDPAFSVDDRIGTLTADQRQQFIDGVPLDDLKAKLTDFGMEAKELMFGVGEDLVTGLIQGTLEMGDILKRFLIGFAGRFILGPLSGALGIASPSKMTAEFGKQIGAGLVVGMDNMKPAVKAAGMALAAAALVPASAANLNATTVPTRPPVQIEPNQRPIEVVLPPMWNDPQNFARTSGGQVYFREANRTARQMGHRD